MDRTYASGAAGSAPAAPASPSIGYPTAGNPGTGTPATKPGPYWYHQITEELLAIITAAGITPAQGALTQLASAIQSGKLFSAVAGGTSDALSASFSPAIASLTNGMSLYVRAGSANATATPTFTPASGTIAAKTIVKGAGAALAAGDIAGGGHWVELQYDLSLDKWVLLNPAKGVSVTSPVATTTKLTSGSGTYTTPAGARQLLIRMVAGGGGGSGGGTAGGTGGTAGTTTFNSINAVGGVGGVAGNGSGGQGGAGGTGSANLRCAGTGGGAGIPSTTATTGGGSGGGSVFSGAGNYGGSGAPNTGGGGSGGASTAASVPNGGGGGGGEYAEIVINNPAASYSYSIGAGGTAGSAGASGGPGGAGGSGVIVVTEFY